MWLIHHGRKGQHWGELNGPPYPLDMTNKEYKKVQSESVKPVKTVKRWSAEEERRLAEKYKNKGDVKIKDKFADINKSVFETKHPKLAEMRNKQLDFIEKYMPTQYKAMEIEAKMYKKMLPKMYELDKKLGYGIVVRNGVPISLKIRQTNDITTANRIHNQMHYGHS